MHELITIAFSHYCEKARWALDRNRVPYREHKYLPMVHRAAAKRALEGTGAGKADGASTRYSTPILLGEPAPLADSSDIVRWAEPALYELEEADALDRWFSEDLGPHTRRVVYWFCFEDPRLLAWLAERNVSVPQSLLMKAAVPLGAARLMRRAMKVDRDGFERSLSKVRGIADEVGERLSDGRPYLAGDRFSAADLSFAAMMSPAICPPPSMYGAVLPPLSKLPPQARELAEEMRAHPAGRFAMRMFEEQRWAQA